jgi:Na+/proline symporter
MQGILPLLVIGLYLAVVMYIGIFAFRRGKSTGEDFFVASRSIGSIVFFLALFATNMTSVAILGSSGFAFKRGIGIYGMMAAISCFVIPLTLFFIGTRLWAIGKRLGVMTQVSFFRDRWECSSIGTIIFCISAFMLMPYLIVSIIGGGTILETLSYHAIPYWLGGAIVALVVMINVFFGGMRGAVWVNVFQTILFLLFGIVAFCVIGAHLPDGFAGTIAKIKTAPDPMPQLLTRFRIPHLEFLSYCLIPLSSIMFPHMAIMCFTAKKVTAFKKSVILYPICITAIWLPCVFLGALAPSQPKVAAMMAGTTESMHAFLAGRGDAPPLLAKLHTSTDLAAQALYADASTAGKISAEEFGQRLATVKDPALKPAISQAAASNSDSVLLHMLNFYSPAWLAGILAAGIISAVMGSDCHQILALSTMFTRDVFDYYGGKKRFGEKGSVFFGRFFILAANSIAYIIALAKPPIFDIAVRYAFSGFAAMAPVMIAALFWKRSTKYGALASTLWIAACLTAQRLVEWHFPKPNNVLASWSLGGQPCLSTNGVGYLNIFGCMPVVPMVLGSCLAVIIASLLTKPPSQATLDKYFPPRQQPEESPSPVPAIA